MTDRRSFALEVDTGRVLHGSIDLPAAPGPRPTVVVCHGFKGFMEWGFFPHLAHLLAARGFTTVRFNFSGAGMRPGDDLVTDAEAFAHATIGNDVRDLEAVLEAVTDGRIAAGRVDSGRLGLLGHSRGGGAAILAAARSRQLAALVTWSAVATFDRLSAAEKDGWRLAGRVPVVNARTGQELELDRSVLEDLETHTVEYDLEAAAAAGRAPWLIVHGEDDETVPVAEGQRLANAAHAISRFEVVADASHTFGAVHPFVGPTAPLIQALNLTQTWLRKHLA
jgi:pimeloyl-ACP methyl ester carboxylesterase